MKTIQIFNHTVESCYQCPFYCKTEKECNYTEIDTNEHEIPTNCPFAKPLSKEDIESFGFEYDVKDELFELKNIKMWQSTIKNNFYYFYNVKNNNTMKFKITSKPHLEFILKTLNII